MDSIHAQALKPGVRVAVYMGEVISQLHGTPPMVTTASVISEAFEDTVWLDVDVAQGETLPQQYRVQEVIGLLMPMALVTHHADGSVTGKLPL